MATPRNPNFTPRREQPRKRNVVRSSDLDEYSALNEMNKWYGIGFLAAVFDETPKTERLKNIGARIAGDQYTAGYRAGYFMTHYDVNST